MSYYERAAKVKVTDDEGFPVRSTEADVRQLLEDDDDGRMIVKMIDNGIIIECCSLECFGSSFETAVDNLRKKKESFS